MANRIDDIDESNSDLVNPDAFLSDITLRLVVRYAINFLMPFSNREVSYE